MYLKYLSQDAVDDIKLNFEKYKSYIKEDKNDKILDILEQNNWLKESKYEIEDIKMNMDADFNISDKANIKVVYEALKSLPPSVATDERIWAGLLFGPLWDFVKYRRKNELAGDDRHEILSSFFFMRGIKRSCFINCLSRLWWTGHLIYDADSNDPYHAADLICEKAYASTIMLISSSNFTSNKTIFLGLFDCLEKRKVLGDEIKRYHYVNSIKYLNGLGGVFLLDMLSRNQISNLANKTLNKLYGVYDIDILKDKEQKTTQKEIVIEMQDVTKKMKDKESVADNQQSYDQSSSIDFVNDDVIDSENTDNVETIYKTPEHVQQPQDDEGVSSGTKSIVDVLKQQGVEYIDKRDVGGALWIIGGEELSNLITLFEKQDIEFVFSPFGGVATQRKPAWWTKSSK